MADLKRIATLINDAIAEADGDLRAAGTLQAILVEAIGLNIAFASDGDAAVASTMCEHATAGVFEQATLAACVLADAGRL